VEVEEVVEVESLPEVEVEAVPEVEADVEILPDIPRYKGAIFSIDRAATANTENEPAPSTVIPLYSRNTTRRKPSMRLFM
jgi:hypothetical protein